jgi:hypothetical protein
VKRHPNSSQRLPDPVLVLALVLVDRCRWLYYISLVTFMLYVFCSCVVLFRLVLVLLAASIMAHSASVLFLYCLLLLLWHILQLFLLTGGGEEGEGDKSLLLLSF